MTEISERFSIVKTSGFVFFIGIYTLPVLLLMTGIIPVEYRYLVLISIGIVLMFYTVFRKLTFKELGISTAFLAGSLFWNLLVSFGLVVVLFFLFLTDAIRAPTIPDWNLFFVFYIFISCPLQEFLYRSLFFAEMKRRGMHKAIPLVIYSAVNFCFLHTFYFDWITSLAGLTMGLVWGLIYYRYPNFWGVAISHAILGSVSIFTGLI